MNDKLRELQNRLLNILQCGGKEEIEKQHKANKLTARERIDILLDENSFVETDAFVSKKRESGNCLEAQFNAEGVITGYGSIGGRLVYVYSQDFTVANGSVGEMHAKKICKIMDMALKMGAPIIGITDSGGARIEEGLDALNGITEIVSKSAMCSGVVPQICAVMGSCAGTASFLPAIADFVFMVDGTSHTFVSGPNVIKGSSNVEITMDLLGGAKVHANTSGLSHFTAANDADCLNMIRDLVGFLPDNNLSVCPMYENSDDINRKCEKLNTITTGNYNMLDVISQIVDDGEIFEVQKDFAENIITAFARMNGTTIGIVANQPSVCDGVLDIACCNKAAGFIKFLDSFNIPIVTFTDSVGFIADQSQEHQGITKAGAKLMLSYCEATSPKINIITGKAYGGAYAAMSSKQLGADLVLAWPFAEISVMNPDGAANILFNDEIKSSDDPVSSREDMICEYKKNYSNPYVAAKKGYVDDVIEPVTTRPRLISALEMLSSKREERPRRKHISFRD